MLDILFTVIGVVLVLKGADWLTDGSVSLARRFSISELVIGLTIVAFGTSLPEFIVSLMASLEGSAAMGIGNVVGSNLFNTLMIVGVTAAIAPIAIQQSTIRKDIPFSILASVVFAALALDRYFGSPDGGVSVLDRGDGIALLGFFGVFMAYSIGIAKMDDPADADTSSSARSFPLWKVILSIVLGLVCLIGGGQFFVQGASGIARSLGLSEAVIGLTLVAGGTSLPELATSVVAARKGQSGIAIGNVIGSNLFNIFWILGVCATIHPMSVNGITIVDFAMLFMSGVFFWFFAKTQHRILRWEGVVLVTLYIAYIVWLLGGF